jgi:hypothetical protein
MESEGMLRLKTRQRTTPRISVGRKKDLPVRNEYWIGGKLELLSRDFSTAEEISS